MSILRTALVCTGALLLAAASPVVQAELPPAGVGGSVSFNFQPPPVLQVTGFGSFALDAPQGAVRLDASPQPSPSLYAEVGVVTGFTGRSGAQLIYHMQLLAPAGADPHASVDVRAAVAGWAAGASITTDPFAAFTLKAHWRLEDINLGLAQVFAEGIEPPALQGSFADAFSHEVTLSLTPGHLYRVTLVADAFAGAASGPWASAAAYIDPVFSFAAGVDPGYAFEFSAGIGNSAPVPEPASWALLGLGLLALRRRLSAARPSA